MADKVLERIFVALKAPEYAEVIRGETAHDHVLIENEHGTYRWKRDEKRELEIMNYFGAIDLNDVVSEWYKDSKHQLRSPSGTHSNDPLVRELYRCIGYSLSGYWEVFYWEVNNDAASYWAG